MSNFKWVLLAVILIIPSPVLSSSYLYVTDHEYLKKYDIQTQECVETITVPVSQGVEKGLDGNIYLSSYLGVQRYDVQTKIYELFASHESIDNAVDLAFGPDGNLYVGSHLSSEIYRFDGTTGAFIDVFTSSADGQLSAPTGLTFGPDGKLYVSSHWSNEILRYDINTRAVEVFANNIGTPHDLVFSSDNVLYATAYLNDTIYTYDLDGNYLGGIDSNGILTTPYGLAFDDNDNLYIANRTNVIIYDGSTFTEFATSSTISRFIVFQTEATLIPEPLTLILSSSGLLLMWMKKMIHK